MKSFRNNIQLFFEAVSYVKKKKKEQKKKICILCWKCNK